MGPKDAFITAFSSQLVDHNLISYTIAIEDKIYTTIPTQNYGFWNDSFPREVYIPFHFFPGGDENTESNREDGKINKFSCLANSANVKKIMVSALKSKNLYRIGIALHTYADSFAHQNFSGKLEDWNIIGNSSIIPAIGHAQALTKPDDPTLVWEDPRLRGKEKKVNNYQRCLTAVKKIYRYLCLFCGKDYDDEDFILERYKKILNYGSRSKQGKERIYDFIIDENVPQYSRSSWIERALKDFIDIKDDKLYDGYSKLLWLRDSLLYRSSILTPKSYKAAENFYDSHFYKWQEEAKNHLSEAQSIINSLN